MKRFRMMSNTTHTYYKWTRKKFSTYIFLASFHAYYLVKETLRFDDALLRRGRLGRARLPLASLRNGKIPPRPREKYKLRMHIDIFAASSGRAAVVTAAVKASSKSNMAGSNNISKMI